MGTESLEFILVRDIQFKLWNEVFHELEEK